MSAIDPFSAIGSENKRPDQASVARAQEEEKAFDSSLSSNGPEDEYRNRYNRGLWEAHLNELRQTRELKEQFSKYVLKYLAIFSFCCLGLLIIEGINPKFDLWISHKSWTFFRFRMGGFHLDDGPLTALIGSTAASAIGLVVIVLQGLFKSKADDKSEPTAAKK